MSFTTYRGTTEDQLDEKHDMVKVWLSDEFTYKKVYYHYIGPSDTTTLRFRASTGIGSENLKRGRLREKWFEKHKDDIRSYIFYKDANGKEHIIKPRRATTKGTYTINSAKDSICFQNEKEKYCYGFQVKGDFMEFRYLTHGVTLTPAPTCERYERVKPTKRANSN